MSFDPHGFQEQPPVPPSGAVPPDRPPVRALDTEARDRVRLPAIFLIVIGVMNLLFSLLPGGGAIGVAMMSADNLHQMVVNQYKTMEKDNPQSPLFGNMVKELNKQDPQAFKTSAVVQYGLLGGAEFIGALVVIIGGMRMLQMRSYGLCILASIVASVPCVSPTCCCFGISGIVGLWSIIVLLSTNVRMAFR
jgi:hypothetical protein